jgi:pimeloyl-ACP methyl ester carboxylesterase
MTHGWPGSVIELLEVVGPLTDPTAHGGRGEDAFHLVLPALPGYGFSGEPAELGWNVARVAQAWAELMRRLGYTRYVAQGGDVGAAVTDAMGRQAPEGLLGIHMNLLVTVLTGPQPAESAQERAAADQLATFRESGFRYFLEMATRPQTIAYALPDSPVALAAWLLDHDTDSYYQDLPRLPRRRARGQSHPRPHRRQHHAVLADGHRRLGGPVRRSRSRSASPPSPARSGGPRAAGSRTPTRRSPTSTRSTGAGTSPLGSPSSSLPRCELHSAHSAKWGSQAAGFLDSAAAVPGS